MSHLENNRSDVEMVVAKLIPDYAAVLILMYRLNCARMVQKVVRIQRTAG
jgi:hypothetical protein